MDENKKNVMERTNKNLSHDTKFDTFKGATFCPLENPIPYNPLFNLTHYITSTFRKHKLTQENVM